METASRVSYLVVEGSVVPEPPAPSFISGVVDGESVPKSPLFVSGVVDGEPVPKSPLLESGAGTGVIVPVLPDGVEFEGASFVPPSPEQPESTPNINIPPNTLTNHRLMLMLLSRIGNSPYMI